MPSEADTKVVGSRITADQLHRVQAIAKELTRRAAGAPVAVAQVVAIMVGRDLPRFEDELGLAPPAAKLQAPKSKGRAA
jgi:hypothetical protein